MLPAMKKFGKNNIVIMHKKMSSFRNFMDIAYHHTRAFSMIRTKQVVLTETQGTRSDDFLNFVSSGYFIISIYHFLQLRDIYRIRFELIFFLACKTYIFIKFSTIFTIIKNEPYLC